MKVVNVTSIAILDQPLELTRIHEGIKGTVFYHKSRWLKMRLPPNNYYIAFYRSGKFLITQKDPEKTQEIAETVVKLLKNIDIDVKIIKIETMNIVVSDEVNLRMNLENLMRTLDIDKASYEPEQFSGLIYKDWGWSFLLFYTGKVIITGLKNIKDADSAIRLFKNVVESI